MKRIASLILVLVMLCGLCACGKQDTEIPKPNTKPSQDTTTGNIEPTSGTTTGSQEEVLANPSTTVTTPDTGADACQHTYTEVSCTTPKMCTKCQHIARNALPHDYKNGACTVCGRAEMLVTFRSDYWVAHAVTAGTREQGEVLSQYVLDPELQRYSAYVCYANAEACTVSTGKIAYGGKAYHSDWYYTVYMDCAHEENDDTVTITVDTRNPSASFTFVLTKTSETQLTVTSSSNTAMVPKGIVFVKQ